MAIKKKPGGFSGGSGSDSDSDPILFIIIGSIVVAILLTTCIVKLSLKYCCKKKASIAEVQPSNARDTD